MDASSRVDHILEELVSLPSLPPTVTKLLELIDQPDYEVADVANLILADQALSMKTLRLVNSAYVGVSNEVTSVQHAVALLGAKVVRNLVTTAVVMDTFQSNFAAMTKHTLACGFATRKLFEKGLIPKELLTSDMAFLCGLLHDVGKIIIEQNFPDETRQIRELVARGQRGWVQAERETLGIDHNDVGTRLATRWRLQEPIVNAIAGHHDLVRTPNPDMRPVAAMTALADYICYRLDFAPIQGIETNPPEEALAFFDLTEDKCEIFIEACGDVGTSVEELSQIAE